MSRYTDVDVLMKDFDGIDLTKCVKYGNKDAEQQHLSYSTMMMYEIASTIDDAPAADVAEVRHGRWEWKKRQKGGFRKYTGIDSMGETHTVTVDERHEINEPFCPYCGKINDSIWLNFCPNCGAMMDKEEE